MELEGGAVDVDVLIATPGSGAKMAYVKSLVRTCEELSRQGITYCFLSRYTSFVPLARELTALDLDRDVWDEKAPVAGGVRYRKIFWIDSDMEWEPEDFLRLYRTEEKIVSGLYALDNGGRVAVNFPSDIGVPTSVNKVEFLLRDDLVEVGGVGFGFLCISAGVFESMPRPWFLIRRLKVREDSEMRVNVGEDYSWCKGAQDAGFKVYVDATVHVKHHKDRVLEI